VQSLAPINSNPFSLADETVAVFEPLDALSVFDLSPELPQAIINNAEEKMINVFFMFVLLNRK
jgi:hypothetical protein